MKKAIILAFLMAFAAAAALHAQTTDEDAFTESTTFILVRHAEKMNDSDDPGLTQQGVLRANKLYEMVSKSEIGAIYSTDYNRTKATVQVVSDKFDIPIGIYEPAPETGVTESWIKNHRGETVLVSGHSNTIPGLANKLLARTYFEDDFDESDYGNLLVITVNESDRNLLHLRF